MMNFSIVFALLLCSSSAIRLKEPDDQYSLPEWAKAPIIWVHAPKTGTSAMNLILHHKGLCPKLPDNTWCLSGNCNHAWVAENQVTERCNFDQEYYKGGMGSQGVARVWEEHHDHVFGFFRQPEKRMTSGYKHKWHDFPHTISKEGVGKNIRGYAKVMQGCQVRMLTYTKKSKACGGDGTEPTDEDVQLAIARMKQMKFVGITEEWDLSVCLFHTMYGGECHDNEFADSRPAYNYSGYKGMSLAGDNIDLKGFKDPYDGALYEAAKERFYSMLKEHDVNRASCEKLCASVTSKPFSLAKQSQDKGLSQSLLESGDAYKYDWPGRRSYSANEDYSDDI